MAMEVLATVAKLRASVADATFKKGQEIVSSSKLRNVVFEGECLEKASAICSGSNPGDSYTLDFCINPQAASNLQSHCSCPAALQAKGGLCKHLVALVLLRIRELRQMKNLTSLPGHPTVSTDGHINNVDANEKSTTHDESSNALQKWEDMLKLAETSAPLQYPCAEVNNAIEVRRRTLPQWMLGVVAGTQGKPPLDAKDKDLKDQKKAASKEASNFERKRKNLKLMSDVEREEGTNFDISNEQYEGLKSPQRGADDQPKSRMCEENEDKMEDLQIPRKGTKGRRAKTTLDKESSLAMQEGNHDTLKKGRQSRQASNKAKEKMAMLNKKSLQDDDYDSDISESEPFENISGLTKPQPYKRLRHVKKMAEDQLEVKVDDRDQSAFGQVELGGRLDLTMAELISIAKKNLANESSRDQTGDACQSYDLNTNVGNPKREKSIFSSTKWKEVFPGRRPQSDVAMSSQFSSEAMNTLHSVEEKRQNEDSLPCCQENLDTACNMEVDRGFNLSQGSKLESTESVAQDMFGLFFGNISSANTEKKSDIAIKFEDIQSDPGKNEEEFKELTAAEPSENLIITANADHGFKKKSSLKDKIKMLLD